MRLSRISSPGKLFLAAVFIYLAAALIMLSHYPPLGVDEGWFGNPAYNLATKGFLGATLMSGFYGTERHTYWMPPFHLLLMAGVFKVFGFGWLQIRLLSVAMGALALVGTYALGRCLFGARSWVGPVAAFLLSGELMFLLSARWGRMEPTVAACAVWGLYFVCKGHSRQSRERSVVCGATGLLPRGQKWWFFLGGLMGALAALSHPNGVFFAPVLLFITWFSPFSGPALGAQASCLLPPDTWKNRVLRTSFSALGALLVFTPYLLYVAQAPADAVNQLHANGVQPSMFLSNVSREPLRYQRYVFPLKTSNVPFMALPAVLLLGGVIVCLVRGRGDRRALVPALTVCTLQLGFCIAPNKTYQYLSLMMPFATLALAYAVVLVSDDLARRSVNTFRLWSLLPVLAVSAFMANNLAGNVAGWWLYRKSSIPAMLDEVRRHVQPSDVIVGDSRFWLAVPDNPYIQTWAPRVAGRPPAEWLQVDGRPATLVITCDTMNAQAGIHSGRSPWDEVIGDCTVLVHFFPDPLGGNVEIRGVNPSPLCCFLFEKERR